MSNKDFHEDIDTDFLEFETKYSVDGSVQFPFKDIIEREIDDYEFLYVEGVDIYYSTNDEFLRHRLPTKQSPRSELTYKSKPKGATSAVARTEVNLRVDKNDVSTVRKFTDMLGFRYNFKITKYCHIYFLEDANLVFYSIKDHTYKESKTKDHYIEIEVNEKLASKLSKEECKAIVRKYESLLEPVGVKHQRRLYKQLFDIYRKF